MQIRLIFRPHWKHKPISSDYLVYAQRFDIIQRSAYAGTDPSNHMHLLKRAKRTTDNSRLGDVLSLTAIRMPIELVPYYDKSADSRLTCYNSMELSTKFWLNRFSDKETYFALLSTYIGYLLGHTS